VEPPNASGRAYWRDIVSPRQIKEAKSWNSRPPVRRAKSHLPEDNEVWQHFEQYAEALDDYEQAIQLFGEQVESWRNIEGLDVKEEFVSVPIQWVVASELGADETEPTAVIDDDSLILYWRYGKSADLLPIAQAETIDALTAANDWFNTATEHILDNPGLMAMIKAYRNAEHCRAQWLQAVSKITVDDLSYNRCPTCPSSQELFE